MKIKTEVPKFVQCVAFIKNTTSLTESIRKKNGVAIKWILVVYLLRSVLCVVCHFRVLVERRESRIPFLHRVSPIGISRPCFLFVATSRYHKCCRWRKKIVCKVGSFWSMFLSDVLISFRLLDCYVCFILIAHSFE